MKLILSACAVSLASAVTYECLESCDHLGSTPSCCEVSPGLSDDVVCCETDRHCVEGTNGLNFCTAFHYDCQSGQGELGASMQSVNLNDADECGLFCDEDPACIAFDYTTRSQGDACRTYAASNTPRLAVGIHTRQYCVAWEFTYPTMTMTNGEYTDGHDHDTDTEVVEDHHYDCLSGQGERRASISSSNNNNEAACEAACDINAACEAFDYTTSSQGDSCRLYGANTPRIGTPGGDNRMYCEHHDGADEVVTEATATPDDEDHHYDCLSGQGERSASISSSNNNNEAACEAACDINAACEAFDYTTSSQGDSCRLYDANTPRIGTPGGDNRMYCEHHDGADEVVVTEDGDYVCVSGQGERRASISDGNNNNEAACGAACDINAACAAFDYTTSSQGDSCRLYGANTPRIGTPGGDNRMYCEK